METLKSCDIGTLQKFNKLKESGGFCIITLDGCKGCPPTKKFLKSKVGNKVPILEIKVNKAKCLDFAIEKLNVRGAPSVLYVKKGKKTRRLAGEHKDIRDSEKEIDRIVSKA